MQAKVAASDLLTFSFDHLHLHSPSLVNVDLWYLLPANIQDDKYGDAQDFDCLINLKSRAPFTIRPQASR